jgi:exosortase A-associated hydrolase 2
VAVHCQPLFVQGTFGRDFGVLFRDAGARSIDRALMIVPPFAEEMNKSRPMMARAATDYAARGGEALIVDLYGTGDSDGDFREASVRRWRDDLRAFTAFLADRGHVSLDVLAVRAGVLLPVHGAIDPRLVLGRLVAWQPAVHGNTVINQFLRLRIAGNVIGSRNADPVNPRVLLREQGWLEVAGYDLSDDLVREFEGLELADVLGSGWSSSVLFELAARSDEPVSPGLRRVIESTGSAKPLACVVSGDPFWASPEIVVVPELLTATAEYWS